MRLMLAGGGLLATAVFWGSAVPFNVVLLRYFDPFVLTTFRMVLSVLILAAFVAWRERGPLWQIPLSLRQFLTVGFFMAGFNVLYTLSVLWSNPITISALSVAMPLTGAIALGLRGGEVLMLVAMFSWNIYSVKAQQWLSQLGQARLTLVSSVSTCLWLVMVMVLMLVLGVAHWPATTPPPTAFAMVFYLALFSAAVGNFLWNFGVSILGLPIASLYINLSAVFAVLIAMAFGFHPTWLQVLGGLIVMAGVLYMQLRKLRAAQA